MRFQINLAKIPAECQRMFVILNLGEGVSIEKLKEVFVTVSGMRTKTTFAQHDWTELQDGDTVVCCSFFRSGGKWTMEVLGRSASLGSGAVLNNSVITNLAAPLDLPWN